MKQEVKKWIRVRIPRGKDQVIQVYEPARRRLTLVNARKANTR